MAKAKKSSKAPKEVQDKIVTGPRVNKLAVLMWLQGHDFYIPQSYIDRSIVPAVGVGGEREFKSSRALWNSVLKIANSYGVGDVERIKRIRDVYHPHLGKGRVIKDQTELLSVDDKFLTVNGNTTIGDYIRIPHATMWYLGKKHKDKNETLYVHVKYNADSIVITKADIE